MKLLQFSDQYSHSSSINWLQCGLSEERESQLISESLKFIHHICNSSTDLFVNAKAPHTIQAIAIMIFFQTQKKIPFSEVDHFVLATICVFIACKIENHQLKYEVFQKFYFDNKSTFLYQKQDKLSQVSAGPC